MALLHAINLSGATQSLPGKSKRPDEKRPRPRDQDNRVGSNTYLQR